VEACLPPAALATKIGWNIDVLLSSHRMIYIIL
jgi:hypothetical protein